MMGSGNKQLNNQIKRKRQQYLEIQDIDGISNDENPNTYINSYNINNNISNINNVTKQNNRMNINNNNNSNIKNKIYDNKNNINNNSGNNTSDINNSNINKVLLILRNEFKKKDERIKSLELKVADLERKINMIKSQNSSPIQNNNNNIINENNLNNKNINLPLNKNFTFAEKNSGEINNNKVDTGTDRAKIDYYYRQMNSSNQYKVNNNKNMLENNYSNKNNVLNEGLKENSMTDNSKKSQSKNEVKLYLKEVKGKVEPYIFKEFIKNIKLLTSSKETNGIDRNIIVENVKLLFGEQYKDLFIKFESIIGVNE